MRLAEGGVSCDNDAEQFALNRGLVALEGNAAGLLFAATGSPRSCGESLEGVAQALLVALGIAFTKIVIKPRCPVLKTRNGQLLDQCFDATDGELALVEAFANFQGQQLHRIAEGVAFAQARQIAKYRLQLALGLNDVEAAFLGEHPIERFQASFQCGDFRGGFACCRLHP